jgi:hypothetical protein
MILTDMDNIRNDTQRRISEELGAASGVLKSWAQLCETRLLIMERKKMRLAKKIIDGNP